METASLERRLRRSSSFSAAVRAGLVGYAVVHLLFAVVAVRLVLGGRGSSSSSTGKGALAQVAGDAWGRWALAGLALGFAALAVWQLIAAALGYRDQDGWRRGLMRVGAAARVVTYGYLAYASANLALAGRSAASGSPDSKTSRVMSLPWGPWLIAAAGLGAAGTGIGLAIFGARNGFVDQLDEEARRNDRRVPIVLVGKVGYVAKGVAMIVVGSLLCWAAWTHDPDKSGGLDQSLRRLLGHDAGTVAVLVVAAGIGVFGVFLLARARHLNPKTLTS